MQHQLREDHPYSHTRTAVPLQPYPYSHTRTAVPLQPYPNSRTLRAVPPAASLQGTPGTGFLGLCLPRCRFKFDMIAVKAARTPFSHTRTLCGWGDHEALRLCLWTRTRRVVKKRFIVRHTSRCLFVVAGDAVCSVVDMKVPTGEGRGGLSCLRPQALTASLQTTAPSSQPQKHPCLTPTPAPPNLSTDSGSSQRRPFFHLHTNTHTHTYTHLTSFIPHQTSISDHNDPHHRLDGKHQTISQPSHLRNVWPQWWIHFGSGGDPQSYEG